jgi:hypothetical protein
MRSSSESIDLERRYGAHNYDHPKLVLAAGEGIRVFDARGRSHLNCLSASPVLNRPLISGRGTIDWALPAIRQVPSMPAREAQGEQG